jgi:predicted nucleic acid-binding protein
MLDPDDEQIMKDAKEGGAVLITWDRVLRDAAGGLTPYEALDMAKA